jgi:hypothetical protein
MLCCIAEIASFVFGILALVKGRFALTGTRVVEGASARVIGVLLLCPLIIGQGGGVAYAFVWMMQHAAQGQAVDLNNLQAVQTQLATPLLIINVAGSAVPLLIALVIAVANARPIRPGRSRRVDEEDDYDDDYPERRGDDEPRRRPPDDRQ